MAHVRALEIDIANQIFHVVGMDDTGTVVVAGSKDSNVSLLRDLWADHCPVSALISLKR
jgi:hypothetical protein